MSSTQDLVKAVQLARTAATLPVRAASLMAPGLVRRRLRTSTRLHLGCGDNVIDGWSNLDMAGPRGVVRFDLRRPLPVATDSVDLIYSEHFIEHVSHEHGLRLLSECHRVLRPGGVIRISTPDLTKLIAEYMAGRTEEWADMDWHPQSPCVMLNEGLRLWGHQFVYDEQELVSSLVHTGFTVVERKAWRESGVKGLSGLESRPFHEDLIVEGTK